MVSLSPLGSEKGHSDAEKRCGRNPIGKIYLLQLPLELCECEFWLEKSANHELAEPWGAYSPTCFRALVLC